MENIISFIGVGQAGGNICEALQEKNFKTGVINTSTHDLMTTSKTLKKLHIGDSEGSAKIRNTAKIEFEKNKDDVADFIKTFESKIIYFALGTGGGTGSGMTPFIIDFLKNVVKLPKIFGVIAAIPSEAEDVQSKLNSGECLKELYDLNLPILHVNNTILQNYSESNLIIADYFAEFLKERGLSKYGVMDHREKLSILSNPGNLVFSKASGNDLIGGIKKDLNSNSIFSFDFDGKIRNISYLLNVKRNMEELIKETEDNLKGLESDIGVPISRFKGIALDSYENSILLIISGAGYPVSVINKMNKDILNYKEKHSKKNTTTFATLSSNMFDDVSEQVLDYKSLT